MAIHKDKIVVIDLEATCWEGFDAPEGQVNEIIEIGVCLIEPRKFPIQVTDKRSILVKPTESIVSPFCTELTSLTQEMVDTQGISFDEACSILENDYDSRNRLWVSWGGFDKEFFKAQCRRRKVRYPLNRKHGNLKSIFQDRHGERMGLMRALETVGIQAQGTTHRGDDDAYNTACLLKYLFERYGGDILKAKGF
jgi:inhibitor of KinA sporulation pathway (predicted exonuclease)